MNNGRLMSAKQKFNMKVFFTMSWGAIAAASGALVSSRLNLSIENWAIFSTFLAAVTLAFTAYRTRSLHLALGTIGGAIAGIITGGALGALIWLTEVTRMPAIVDLACALALFFTTWAGQTKLLNTTRFSRGSTNWALTISLLVTVTAILTSSFNTRPELQPILGGLLGMWSMLLIVAFIDADTQAR